MAYLLNRPMMFFEKLLSKTKLPKKAVRALSVAIVYVLVIGILVFLIISIVPQFIESITTVSYTHLDVYKRQSEYRRRQKRRRQRSAFILVLILCVLFFFLGRCSSSSVYLDVVDPGSAPSASPVSNGSANGNELLTLVNSKHPLPSGWKVSLVQLKNGQSIDRRAYAALQDMMDDARRAGLSPLICSSYRTRAKQEELHKNQVQKFLSEGYSQSMAEQKASQWVAPPGTSEHELGLAVDIVATDHQLLDETQEHTPEQKWLMENCWKYGLSLIHI